MLLVIGFHSLIGGGQTPILAAGFHTIADQFDVSLSKVAITTGAYMFSLGIGSVVAGSIAAVYGKRVVYLAGQVIFCASCVWAALSQSYASLLAARIVEGFGVSPVECLPSSSIAEIFFLHERAFRLGIYTMLLVAGGKNLVPLISAIIIQSLGWRWVFGIVAMIVGLNFVLTFLFVPETSWDRNVKPAPSLKTITRRASSNFPSTLPKDSCKQDSETQKQSRNPSTSDASTVMERPPADVALPIQAQSVSSDSVLGIKSRSSNLLHEPSSTYSASARSIRRMDSSYINQRSAIQTTFGEAYDYRAHLPPKYVKRTWRQQLAITNGRLTQDPWWKIVLRPFALFAYPAILYATIVYSLSVVWLIVLSESLAQIFQAEPYNFSALSTGLLYVSPLVGGILGSSVAGKVSDLITRHMAKKNNGVYEPEFRLIMAAPVGIITVLGLMGFGWSAYEQDPWIAPTVFFGCISFGCSLGSTLSISFVVDSYRQHAGEALITLNLTKNTLGFIFSLWFNRALTADGSRTIFIILGMIQLVVCLAAIPMYIYGKRCRSWTFRSGMLDRLYG